ncbi:MAG: hypothetical protein C5B49_02055 [Bdellovibrio sp.]|nr:MAG: hypothetical protein C5B49_02055 [Bdellovibrio sp.]
MTDRRKQNLALLKVEHLQLWRRRAKPPASKNSLVVNSYRRAAKSLNGVGKLGGQRPNSCQSKTIGYRTLP